MMSVNMVKGGASLALFAIAVAVAVAVGVVLRRRRASPSEDPGLTGSDAEVETRGDVHTTGAATRTKALTPGTTAGTAATPVQMTSIPNHQRALRHAQAMARRARPEDDRVRRGAGSIADAWWLQHDKKK